MLSPLSLFSRGGSLLLSNSLKNFFKELLKRSESKLLRCHKHADVRTRGKSGKVIRWPWKITCGICNKNIQMRYDSDLKGRISYFDRRKSNVMSVKGNRLRDQKVAAPITFKESPAR